MSPDIYSNKKGFDSGVSNLQYFCSNKPALTYVQFARTDGAGTGCTGSAIHPSSNLDLIHH